MKLKVLHMDSRKESYNPFLWEGSNTYHCFPVVLSRTSFLCSILGVQGPVYGHRTSPTSPCRPPTELLMLPQVLRVPVSHFQILAYSGPCLSFLFITSPLQIYWVISNHILGHNIKSLLIQPRDFSTKRQSWMTFLHASTSSLLIWHTFTLDCYFYHSHFCELLKAKKVSIFVY